jgi:prepilin-type N-terminal cleavage/methylation domain-containing protein
MKRRYILKKIDGFTLTELLVAIGIFSILGTVTVAILFLTLRTSKKSDVLISLNQTGNALISQVGRNIRYARSLDSPLSCVAPNTTQSITVTSSLDNGQTTYSCVAGGSSAIASNGASLTDISQVSVPTCSFTCTQRTLNDPPTINFSFTLESKNPTGLLESSGSIPFQTSVTLRNYNR